MNAPIRTRGLTHALERLITAACLAALGVSAAHANDTQLGGLVCKRIEGSGVNLIVTSKADVRCVFSGDAGSRQWYRGDTGVGLGLDLKFTSAQTVNYLIISSTREFVPEGEFLNGSFGGAKAEAAAGIGIGAQVLLGGSNDTISLQPAVSTSEGAGLTAGVSYLNLESDPLNRARIATPYGQLLTQAMYSGYFDVAFQQYHREPEDYAGSDHFSAKAMQAANGSAPEPDAAATWNLSGQAQADADAARARLVAALQDTGGADVDAGMAQVSYDCWLYGMANAPGAPLVEGCRTAFLDRVDKVETAAAQAKAEESILAESVHLILFDTDSDQLSQLAVLELGNAVARIKRLEDGRVELIGNADRTGRSAYNAELSERRAATVRAALESAGVPTAWISTEARGDTDPISISRNPHDALNRRVDVIVIPNVAKESAVIEGGEKLKQRKSN